MLYVLLGFRLIAFTVFDFFTTYYIVFQDHAQDKYWPSFANFAKNLISYNCPTNMGIKWLKIKMTSMCLS